MSSRALSKPTRHGRAWRRNRNDVTGELFRKKTGETPPERGSAQWRKFWNQWANLLSIALTEPPQVRRWDKERRLTRNDLHDLEHASAALAHCRAFFTEGRLRHDYRPQRRVR